MNKEEKKAVEDMNSFANGINMSCVTARQLQIVLNLIVKLQKENEELKKDYYNVINKIENKIDRFDYEFEKSKRQNDKDKSDYYWNLIINFTELLESEE